MKVLTTTVARKEIKTIVDRAKYRGEVFGIGRRDSIDAILIGFPRAYSNEADDITNVNAYSKSFDFLADEPDMYSTADVKKRYA
ncbi:MAG: hypothetical protein AAB947_00315 [Patescibacteria group bacterium]